MGDKGEGQLPSPVCEGLASIFPFCSSIIARQHINSHLDIDHVWYFH